MKTQNLNSLKGIETSSIGRHGWTRTIRTQNLNSLKGIETLNGLTCIRESTTDAEP